MKVVESVLSRVEVTVEVTLDGQPMLKSDIKVRHTTTWRHF